MNILHKDQGLFVFFSIKYYYSCVSTEGRRNGFLGLIIISNSNTTQTQQVPIQIKTQIRGMFPGGVTQTCGTAAFGHRTRKTHLACCDDGAASELPVHPVHRVNSLFHYRNRTLSKVLLLFPPVFILKFSAAQEETLQLLSATWK